VLLYLVGRPPSSQSDNVCTYSLISDANSTLFDEAQVTQPRRGISSSTRPSKIKEATCTGSDVSYRRCAHHLRREAKLFLTMMRPPCLLFCSCWALRKGTLAIIEKGRKRSLAQVENSQCGKCQWH
jgi:hypothetical protein